MNQINPENKNQKILKVPTEVFTRVVGYYRPVNQMNLGKKEEHRDRIKLRIPSDVRSWYVI